MPPNHGGATTQYLSEGAPCAGPNVSRKASSNRSPCLSTDRLRGKALCKATGGADSYQHVALVVDVAVVYSRLIEIVARAARARAEVVAVPVLIVGRARYKLVLEAPPSRAAHRELRGRELAALFIYKAPSMYQTRAGHGLHYLAPRSYGPAATSSALASVLPRERLITAAVAYLVERDSVRLHVLQVLSRVVWKTVLLSCAEQPIIAA